MKSGQVVAGKYRLNQLLGQGGMAEVWSATNTFTERQLAIKFMSAQVAKTPEAAARFLKEAKVSARVNHPNIIDILDVGQTEDGQLFLVMELLTGFPLEVAIRRQNPPMTVYEFALVMIEVGNALAAAHKSGIVHRDLKPTNIFLHKIRDGVAIPKLLDFGVSKFLEEDQNHALTVAGTVLGSPLYMSPEQARGEAQLDGRTDVFAFGAIMFEALCGYRPYEAKNFNALIVKIATTKPKSIDECAPGVPDSVRRVVRACMEVDLAHRVQTFEEVVQMLRAALPELQDSTARLPTPLIATSVVDPDATNALPVLRASDRPPPAAPISYHPPGTISASVPPGAVPTYTASGPTGPSWHTPNTSYASIHTKAPSRPGSGKMIAAVAAAGALVVVIGAAVVWKARSPVARATTMTATAAPASTTVTEATGATSTTGTPQTTPQGRAGEPGATPALTTTVTSASSTELPSVSVDALPGAAKALGPVPRGSGRLLVSAGPGWCALSIDGKESGPTPLAGVDLPAGAHQLECRAPGGKVKKASVTIHDGATARYKFALDD